MKKINEKFISEFFGMGDSPEEKKEIAGIAAKLKRIVFENNADICVIDDEPDGMYFIESGAVEVLGRDGTVTRRDFKSSYWDGTVHS